MNLFTMYPTFEGNFCCGCSSCHSSLKLPDLLAKTNNSLKLGDGDSVSCTHKQHLVYINVTEISFASAAGLEKQLPDHRFRPKY